VSVDSSGNQANGQTGYAAISSNGNIVAFHGLASNLVSADSNGQQDVFLKYRSSGAVRVVSHATGSNLSTAIGNGLSGSVAITPDGSFAAYHSQASNLVSGDTNSSQDIFVTRLAPWFVF
jgi:hypothetical protein